jgi:hypothetical protein
VFTFRTSTRMMARWWLAADARGVPSTALPSVTVKPKRSTSARPMPIV